MIDFKNHGEVNTNLNPANDMEFYGEVATFFNDIYYLLANKLLQPNDPTLWKRAGMRRWDLYQDLKLDCHVMSELMKRVNAAAGLPWSVTAASEAEKDVLCAGGITQILKNSKFAQLCEDLLDAILKGFAAEEIVWGEMENQIVPVRFKNIAQRRFGFGENRELRLLTRFNIWPGEEVPAKKFIVHSFNPINDIPYGIGLGASIYWPVYFKRKACADWQIFCERFAAPSTVGIYPSGANEAEQTKALNVAKALRIQTSLAIPDNIKVEMREAQRTGSMACYENLIAWCNAEISKCILGHANPSDTAGGQRAAESVRDAIRLEIIKDDTEKLASTLNDTLILWLTQLNYPDCKQPRLTFSVEAPQDMLQEAQKDQILAGLFDVPVRYLQTKYKVPQMQEGDVAAKGASGGFGGGGFAEAEFQAPFQSRTHTGQWSDSFDTWEHEIGAKMSVNGRHALADFMSRHPDYGKSEQLRNAFLKKSRAMTMAEFTQMFNTHGISDSIGISETYEAMQKRDTGEQAQTFAEASVFQRTKDNKIWLEGKASELAARDKKALATRIRMIQAQLESSKDFGEFKAALKKMMKTEPAMVDELEKAIFAARLAGRTEAQIHADGILGKSAEHAEAENDFMADSQPRDESGKWTSGGISLYVSTKEHESLQNQMGKGFQGKKTRTMMAVKIVRRAQEKLVKENGGKTNESVDNAIRELKEALEEKYEIPFISI